MEPQKQPGGLGGHTRQRKPKGWKPATKAEQTMAPMYIGMDRSRRIEIAVAKVVEEGMTQAEAARMLGVTRPRVNEATIARKKQLAAAHGRIAVAAAERAAVSQPQPEPEVVTNVTTVPLLLVTD